MPGLTTVDCLYIDNPKKNMLENYLPHDLETFRALVVGYEAYLAVMVGSHADPILPKSGLLQAPLSTSSNTYREYQCG